MDLTRYSGRYITFESNRRYFMSRTRPPYLKEFRELQGKSPLAAGTRYPGKGGGVVPSGDGFDSQESSNSVVAASCR